MKIDLENIVYFRSDTHYFVMTAKKDSLLERGVIKKDTYDRDTMLRSDNIDRKQLEKFAIDASQVRNDKSLQSLGNFNPKDFELQHNRDAGVGGERGGQGCQLLPSPSFWYINQ